MKIENIVTQLGTEIVIGTHKVLLASVNYSAHVRDEEGRQMPVTVISIEGEIVGEVPSDG